MGTPAISCRRSENSGAASVVITESSRFCARTMAVGSWTGPSETIQISEWTRSCQCHRRTFRHPDIHEFDRANP